jgi:hypothetical protein
LDAKESTTAGGGSSALSVSKYVSDRLTIMAVYSEASVYLGAIAAATTLGPVTAVNGVVIVTKDNLNMSERRFDSAQAFMIVENFFSPSYRDEP